MELPLWTTWTLFWVQVATLAALVVYVIKTWEIASATARAAQASADATNEMRIARETLSAPRISVYFRTVDTSLAYIVLENRGESAAQELSVQFSPPLQSSLDNTPSTFFDSTKVLAPHSELAHGFDVWHQYFGRKLPLRYSVIVKYRRTDTGKEVEEEHILDAEGFRHLRSFSRKGLHELAEAQLKQANHLDKITNALVALTDAAAERYALSPSQLSLGGELSTVEALWKLLKHHLAESTVFPDRSAFLEEMRRHTLGAIVRAQELNADKLLTALCDLHAALSHYRFHSMGDQTEQYGAVDGGLAKVRDELDQR